MPQRRRAKRHDSKWNAADQDARRRGQRFLSKVLGTVSLVGSCVTILASPDKFATAVLISAGLVLLVAVVSLSYWFLLGRGSRHRSHTKERDLLEDARDAACRYVRSSATTTDLKWIADVERRFFGRDAIPLRLLRKWYEKNPTGFQVVRTARRRRPVGFINILPLEPSSLNEFVSSHAAERMIPAEALCSTDQRQNIQYLYVEAVVTFRGDMSGFNPGALGCLLREHRDVVSDIADPAGVKRIYALGATRSGNRLMHRLGFCLVQPGTERPDGHNLYRITYHELANRLAELFD